MLAVDRDPLAAGEGREVDPVPGAAEANLDPLVDQGLAVHPLAEAGLVEDVDRPLFQHAGADAVLDVLPAAVLDDNRLDAFAREQVREQEPGRPRPHDSHLRALLQHQRQP